MTMHLRGNAGSRDPSVANAMASSESEAPMKAMTNADASAEEEFDEAIGPSQQ